MLALGVTCAARSACMGHPSGKRPVPPPTCLSTSARSVLQWFSPIPPHHRTTPARTVCRLFSVSRAPRGADLKRQVLLLGRTFRRRAGRRRSHQDRGGLSGNRVCPAQPIRNGMWPKDDPTGHALLRSSCAFNTPFQQRYCPPVTALLTSPDENRRTRILLHSLLTSPAAGLSVFNLTRCC